MTEKQTGTKPSKAQRERNLSKDGKWRSFPKAPGLLQYVSTGTYFARVKVDGKLFRQSLETTVYTTALEKLPDFKKKFRKKRFVEGTFGEALINYERALDLDHALSDHTKRYRKHCLKKLLNSWPGLKESKLSKIKPRECAEWAAALRPSIDAQYFNNTLGTLRAVFREGGIEADSDPSRAVKRAGVKIEREELPNEDAFQSLLDHLDKSTAWKAKRGADMIRFLAFSGCRISEARRVSWADVDFEPGFMRVYNAKTRGHQDHDPIRKVPIIPPMRELLDRLKAADPKPAQSDFVLPFDDCEKTLANACHKLKIARLTHHSLRHYFATRAIEKGIPVPTVAAWLGHQDRGALLLRRYRHDDDKHSLEAAKLFTVAGKEAA